jgi:nitronate monooxygenase
MLERLAVPIVQAPMAGGPSTPRLAAAVSGAGGLGMLAAGYRTADGLREDVAAARGLGAARLGVNVFVPPAARTSDRRALDRYAEAIADDLRRAGVAAGRPRFDDDGFAAKLESLLADPVDVVSFTFGCPGPAVVAELRQAGSAVWVTVTTPAEAAQAAAAGADALVVQGLEAGGHRGSFADDDGRDEPGLLALLQLVRAAVDLPLVGTGGIADGRGVAAVLAAGARAAQLGTAFLLCPEAATSAPHRAALATGARTALTRAFTGRLARGIENGFLREHSGQAPRAYPEVHHLTAPLRAHGRAIGDGEVLNLWAGQAHALAREVPAAQLVQELAGEARRALDAGRRLLG